jgi:hypothetical protein
MVPVPMLVPPKNGTASFTYWKESESKNLFVKTSKTRGLMNYCRGNSLLLSTKAMHAWVFCCLHLTPNFSSTPPKSREEKRELIMNECMDEWKKPQPKIRSSHLYSTSNK